MINRTPSKLLLRKTPYEILNHRRPSYDHIRVFGMLCFAQNRLKAKDKFASHSRKFLFMGYPFGKKGWRLYDSETHEFFVSRDVIFHKHIFPFAQNINKDHHKKASREIQSNGKNSAPAHILSAEEGSPATRGAWMSSQQILN